MAKGPGVSVDRQDNGRWRVRWRETVEEEGDRRRVQRSRTVEDEATARVVAAKVLQQLERGELPDLDPVREVPAVATLDAVIAGWLRASAARGDAAGSLRTYGYYAATVLRVLREIGRVREGEQIPGELLTRETVLELVSRLRRGGVGRAPLLEATVRSQVRVLLAAWVWASDDPEAYPGLAPAPRDPYALLPRAPLYAAPPAPTMAECDAMIVRLPRDRGRALQVALLGRCTGLRVAQLMALRVGDVRLDAARLVVSTGKSRREKLGRVVPIAPVLLPYLEGLVYDREPTELLVGRAKAGPTKVLAAAWEEATQAGLVRRETWDAVGRGNARPDHAFRAAFQAHLVGCDVRDEIIDALVGHAGGVRSRHYVSDEARWEAMARAVATIPPLPALTA